MNISGLVVRANPAKYGAVRARLGSMDGVEVHAEDGNGRLVVTVEDVGGRGATDTFTEINGLDGVIVASLVYHYSDDGLTAQEAEQ